jgi:hypothetical protein
VRWVRVLGDRCGWTPAWSALCVPRARFGHVRGLWRRTSTLLSPYYDILRRDLLDTNADGTSNYLGFGCGTLAEERRTRRASGDVVVVALA